MPIVVITVNARPNSIIDHETPLYVQRQVKDLHFQEYSASLASMAWGDSGMFLCRQLRGRLADAINDRAGLEHNSREQLG